MKCAVIVGVVHMTLGLVFSAMNHVHRRDWAKLLFSFVPEMVFLMCTFGYMSILIVVKWTTKFDNTHLAPSLLETMTNFFLSPGYVTVELYAGQAGLQVFLLLVAFLATPVMLLAMPYIEIRKMKKREEEIKKISERRERHVYHGTGAPPAGYSPVSPRASSSLYDKAATDAATENKNNHNSNMEGSSVGSEAGSWGPPDEYHHEQHDTTEIRIHYIIHTIEFVLGAVSNTASYLRLWALSLAHAQLSEVFFNFGLVQTISSDDTGVLTVVGSSIWLAATVGVLLGMEALSAFLHALRLHWVEFQNKFYAGDGTPFHPLRLLEVSGAISTAATSST
jgi:V-type H+-transporting ATPase subunit a